jgi:hypothetical protein
VQHATKDPWWTVEAHFRLHGYIVKQNVRCWASDKSRLTISEAQRPEGVPCPSPGIGIFSLEFVCSMVTFVFLPESAGCWIFHLLNAMTFEWMQQSFYKMISGNFTPIMTISFSLWRYSDPSLFFLKYFSMSFYTTGSPDSVKSPSV